MPGFDEIQFPVKSSYGLKAKLRYKTTIITVDSGDEQRIGHWANGRREFTFDRSMRRTEYKKVLSFFQGRRGSLYGFRFKDWQDYSATRELMKTTVGSASAQMQITYPDSIRNTIRMIRKPVNGDGSTLDNGGIYAPPIVVIEKKIGSGAYTDITSGCTVAYTTGIVTLPSNAASGETYYWSGDFDTPVRFNTDLDIMREAMDIINLQGTSVIEVTGV